MTVGGEPHRWKQRKWDDVSVLEPQTTHSRQAAWGESGSTAAAAAHPAVWWASFFFFHPLRSCFPLKGHFCLLKSVPQRWFVGSVDCFPLLIEDYFHKTIFLPCSDYRICQLVLYCRIWHAFFCTPPGVKTKSGAIFKVCVVIRYGSLLIWQSWNLDLPHRKSNSSLSATGDCCWQRRKSPLAKWFMWAYTASARATLLTDLVWTRPSHLRYRASVGGLEGNPSSPGHVLQGSCVV